MRETTMHDEFTLIEKEAKELLCQPVPLSFSQRILSHGILFGRLDTLRRLSEDCADDLLPKIEELQERLKS